MPAPKTALHCSATLHGGKLKVQGEITIPPARYTVTLKKKTPREINPTILLLEKTVPLPQR
jgi:hypothetical protein